MSSRRSFIKNIGISSTVLALPYLHSFTAYTIPKPFKMKHLKISLAQWSLHRALEKGDIKAIDFAKIAKEEFDIHAVEYVNQFYTKHAKSEVYWQRLKERATDLDVKSLLIMVDNEGDLGNPKSKKRKTAVENHFKWIHAAKILGCHSIRVNAFGEGSTLEIKSALVDGLGQLASYGAKENINVLIENHGLHTSDADFIVEIIKEVNHSHLGTLPDFGNWCLETQWGSTQNNSCSRVYDRYKGVTAFLPYAKGISAKSYQFNETGEETIIDFERLLKVIKASDFDGHVGIEFEGETIPEADGIRATKALLEKVWSAID